MAIKISGTDVIGNSRELVNITTIDSDTLLSISKGLMVANTIVSGTTIRAGRDDEISKAGLGFIEAARFGVFQKGSINLFFEIVSTSNFAAVRIDRIRDGSTTTLTTFFNNSTTYTGENTTQSTLPGDVFIFLIQGNSGTTGRIRNMRVRTSSDTYYIPTLESAFFGWTREQT